MAPGIPPVAVDAAAPEPGRLVGLYAAARLIDVPRSVVGGVEVEVEGVGGHGLWPDPCAPGDLRKEGASDGNTIAFKGTAVWAADECHLLGVEKEEAEQKARVRLARFEPIDAEKFAIEQISAAATEGTSLAEAQAAVLLAGMSPVVHVAPESLEALITSQQVMLVNQRLQTPLGASVAVGAGYSDTLGAGEAIVTGPVTVWRSPVDSYVSYSLSKNTRLAVAERPLAVSWKSPTVKIGVTP